MSLLLSGPHLHSISLSPPDITLLTLDNLHIPTQQLLLAAASPFLASLLAQAGAGQGGFTNIYIPFTSKVVRRILQVLGRKEMNGNDLVTEELDAARHMGMMVIKKDVMNAEEKECDTLVDFVFGNNGDEFTKDESTSPKDESSIVSIHKVQKGKEGKKTEPADNLSNAEKFDIKCQLCEKTFSTKGIKVSHMKTVHSDVKPFPCEMCGKCFRTAGILKTHTENIHTSVPQSACPHCGKTFQHIESHIKHMHEERGRTFTCEECGKLFKSKQDVSKHQRCHLPDDIKKAMKDKELEKHQCNICGLRFIDSTRLRWHEAAKHTGIKDFFCQYCPKSYFRSDHLKTHVISTHGALDV